MRKFLEPISLIFLVLGILLILLLVVYSLVNNSSDWHVYILPVELLIVGLAIIKFPSKRARFIFGWIFIITGLSYAIWRLIVAIIHLQQQVLWFDFLFTFLGCLIGWIGWWMVYWKESPKKESPKNVEISRLLEERKKASEIVEILSEDPRFKGKIDMEDVWKVMDKQREEKKNDFGH